MLLSPLEVISAKHAHLARLTNEGGASGEQLALSIMDRWVARPKGPALRILIEELAAIGIKLKASSFDALALPKAIDLSDRSQVQLHLSEITFIEIKTANQPRVQPGFKGFFFALTESEIAAAEQLGARHRVALFNKLTGELLITSVPEIISRTTSMNWQLSVQL
ncbi:MULTISPECIES: hypothetical protein [Rhizobium/Agrobacterium group]|uniref:hypothetical protein n=1 Tax=Rhizobium/Agrobacterium group TaxID=227290 RepID=UPI0008DC0999|nr:MULTISPECIES: hypothetical protein [Rhizobium/Agrobacterium group]MCF1436533.1 hypothetical protein [Allorhizobium ampelinum]MCF1464448.1 hypothetical protein [Allorhizobium ampelinum]MCF1495816.1 hypothetical protein [Allorhizobium ampelinum]MUO91182.1 hypothetical protein [Agrobacterium vitis]MUZ54255.1 hypothetical protein [Agrobacterium vitis]